MKFIKLIYLATGLTFLYLVFANIDTGEVIQHILNIGWAGFLVVLFIYNLNFLVDVLGWHVTLVNVPMTGQWVSRLYGVRLVGQAFNEITPLASLGGEPIKAALLNKHYGIRYRDAGASLVLAKTADALSLIVFLVIGFLILITTDILDERYKIIAGTGLIVVTVGILIFYAIQRYRITSKTLARLNLSRFHTGIERLVDFISETDSHIAVFYHQHKKRFIQSLILGFLNWMIGVVEIYAILWFLDSPITLVEAWVIESIAQLVRTGTFFIPASIGALEGAFMLIFAGITGSPALGVAVSLIRRARQLIWVMLGLALGWFSLSLPLHGAEKRDSTG